MNYRVLFLFYKSSLDAEIPLLSRLFWVQLGLYLNKQYDLIMIERFIFAWALKVFVEWFAVCIPGFSCERDALCNIF